MKVFKSSLLVVGMVLSAFSVLANSPNAGSGTVAETAVAGGYVYVRLAEDDTWLAATQQPVAVGDKVEYSRGMLMQDFSSQSLGRTFESIYFVADLNVNGSKTDGHHGSMTMGQQQAQARPAPVEDPKPGEIAPLDGGKTIMAIHAESEALRDQEIAVRARVMKISKNIMGKHWVTLKDGTGESPDDRLIATTQEDVSVGDVVIVSGVVHKDVDLGAGYHYPVLLEQAKFSQ